MLEKTNKDGEILRLKKEIEKLKKNIKKQRYGLVWVDVPEAFEDDTENKLPILKEVLDLEIKSKDDKPQHILIEGDNYHALTCLNYTHKGKIDVIYIDPPYNTGQDGFRYKDKRILDKFPDGTVVPKDSPYRHSYWLSFMSKRLELAKKLLKETGVIFISIDDNEFAQLKLLCDGIFNGENKQKNKDNFIAHLPTIMNLKGNNDQFGFSGVHEHTLVYSKNRDKVKIGEFDMDIEELEDWKEDEIGLYKKADTLKRTGQDAPREKRPKGWFPVFITADKKEVYATDNNKPFDKKDFIIWPVNDVGEELSWSWNKKKINSENYNLIITETGGKLNIYKKQRPKLGDLPTKKPKTVFYKSEYSTSNATNQLKKLFGKKIFDNPKPVELIEDFIKLGGDKNSIILDFFAGSGTTAHAVMKINKEDSGGRQFIVVTNNENNIMSDVCHPRIKKAIKGYNKINGLGGSVKYYKTDFIGKNNILFADDKDKTELAHNAGELLAIAENTLNQEKSNKYFQVFKAKNEDKYTAVYFREELDKFDDFIDEVLKIKGDVAVYMFSWEDNEEVEEFEDCKNITVKTIPKPILEIYKQIYNLA